MSDELAVNLRALMTAFGFLPTMNQRSNGLWILGVSGRQLAPFSEFMGNPITRQGRIGQRFITDNDCFYVPIEEVIQEKYTGIVYNLEVEGDNSYCAEGIAVHNCTDAQACGTPIITTKGSSMPQVTCNGIVTEPLHPWWTGFGGWQTLPDPEAIFDAMCQIYDWDDKTRKANSRKGVKFIKDNFDFDEVVFPKYWVPFLEKVEDELRRRGSRAYLTHERNWQKVINSRKKVKVEEDKLAEKTPTEKAKE